MFSTFQNQMQNTRADNFGFMVFFEEIYLHCLNIFTNDVKAVKFTRQKTMKPIVFFAKYFACRLEMY